MAGKFRYSLNVGPLDKLVMPTLPAMNSPEAAPQRIIDRSFSDPTESSNDPGFLSRIFDLASRPRYAFNNVIKDAIDQSDPFDPFWFNSAWKGLTGEDKTVGADILDQISKTSGGDIEFSPQVKGAAGLAWDLGADPLNAIPVGPVANAVGKGTKAVGGFLRGAKKEAEAIASGEGITRHSAEDIAKRGGTTERMTEGEVMPNPGLAEPAPGRLPDIEVPEGTPGNPRAQGPGYQPPDFLQEILGPVNPRNESGAFPMGTGSDAFTPKVMAPSTDAKVTATAAHDAAEDYVGPIGRNNRGQVYVKDKNGMTIAVREQAPPEPLQLAPARKELMPGNLETKPPRTFEVGMPTTQGWDLTPNDIPQSYQLAQITKDARAAIPPIDDLTPMQRKFAVQAQIQNDLKAAKDADIAAGNAPVVPFDGENYYLHLSDVVDSIPAKDFARMHLNVRANIPPSSILHGAAAVIKASNLGLREENLFAYVRDAMHKANKTSRRISETELKKAVNVLIDARQKLQYHLVHNEKMILKSDYMSGKAIGNAVAREIKTDLANPRISHSKELVRVADLYGNISRQIRAAGGTPGEAMAAASTARKALDGVVDDLDVAAARDTLAMSKAAQRGDEVALRRRALEMYTRDSAAMGRISEENAKDFALMLARNVPPEAIKSEYPHMFADLMDREINDYLNGFERFFKGTARNFVAGSRQGKLFGARRTAQSSSGMLNNQFRDDINKLIKDVGEERFNDTFYQIGSGIDPIKLSKSDQMVYDRLYPLMKDIIDPAGGFIDNAIFRATTDSEAFDAMAKGRGLPWLELTKRAKYKGEPLAQIWQREARNIFADIKHPREFLYRFHAMATDAATFSAVARSMEVHASSLPKKGFSRIAQTGTFEQNPLSRFLNLDKHYPDEIIEQARAMQNEILRPVNWGKQDTPLAKFMNKVFDPSLRIWKAFATILRPGHHWANMMGDTASNFMVGVKPWDYYASNEALRSVGLVGRSNYEALERALYSGMRKADYKSPGAMGHAFDIHLKDGTVISNTHGQVGEKLLRSGALSDFRTIEDTELAGMGAFGTDDVTKNPINKVTDKILNSRPGRVMEKVSEWNSNTQRAAQVINRMRDPKFTRKFATEEDAWQEAVAEALKTHPDSAGLTAFEKKYGRRLIPFYSWNRQILPWVMTNFLVNTRRSMYQPKLQYNIAVMAGQDPESGSFPYTNPAGLPAWAFNMLSGNIMGDTNDPQGMNFGYSLSTPLDTLSDWTNQANTGGNPIPQFVKQGISSVNPLFTLPFDVNNPAKDKSEEIDERIPGAATFKSISGISPSGTVANLASGIPSIDPTRQVQQGKRDMLFNEALINFLTGLKIQDFSDYSGFNKPQVRTSSR